MPFIHLPEDTSHKHFSRLMAVVDPLFFPWFVMIDSRCLCVCVLVRVATRDDHQNLNSINHGMKVEVLQVLTPAMIPW